MRIFTEQAIKEYAEAHPDAKVALQEWTTIVKRSEWTCFADVKKTFNSVDNIGNQHYVFNIKGNSYRLIVVIKFTIKFVYIRFIGTHAEYDKIADCSVSCLNRIGNYRSTKSHDKDRNKSSIRLGSKKS